MKRFIKAALLFALPIYFLMLGNLLYSAIAQPQQPSIFDLDKRVSILESKEQDRRENNTLLWTVFGSSVVNLLVSAYIAKGKRSE